MGTPQPGERRARVRQELPASSAVGVKQRPALTVGGADEGEAGHDPEEGHADDGGWTEEPPFYCCPLGALSQSESRQILHPSRQLLISPEAAADFPRCSPAAL